MADSLEKAAIIPVSLKPDRFNPNAQLPYGCTVEAVRGAMQDFLAFLSLINTQLHGNDLPRLESLCMPANFSSIVGEFMSAGIPKHCPTIVKNRYHNGHPDLIPAKTFPKDAVQHDHRGIEVKASRYRKGWQGHNAEDVFLVVFVFQSSRPSDEMKSVKPMPFGFVEVLGAQLEKSDWLFAGRSATSRRTITASVTRTGFNKMSANWIYRDSSLVTHVPEGKEPEAVAIAEEAASQPEAE